MEPGGDGPEIPCPSCITNEHRETNDDGEVCGSCGKVLSGPGLVASGSGAPGGATKPGNHVPPGGNTLFSLFGFRSNDLGLRQEARYVRFPFFQIVPLFALSGASLIGLLSPLSNEFQKLPL